MSFAQADVRDEDAIAARRRGGRSPSTDASTRSSPRPASPAAGPRTCVDRDEWQRVLDINLTGTFSCAKHAIAHMLEQEPVDGERGSVVTIASVEGLEGTAGGSSYNASKGAVVIFTKNLAIDYGRAGIRANAICPGFIETPMLEGVFGMPGMEDVRDDIREEHKLAPPRPARRDRGGRRVPRVGRRVVRHRPGDRRRRRLHGRPRPRRHEDVRVVRAWACNLTA